MVRFFRGRLTIPEGFLLVLLQRVLVYGTAGGHNSAGEECVELKHSKKANGNSGVH